MSLVPPSIGSLTFKCKELPHSSRTQNRIYSNLLSLNFDLSSTKQTIFNNLLLLTTTQMDTAQVPVQMTQDKQSTKIPKLIIYNVRTERVSTAAETSLVSMCILTFYASRKANHGPGFHVIDKQTVPMFCLRMPVYIREKGSGTTKYLGTLLAQEWDIGRN